jgi:NitT/TauT family transport system permease protein
MRKVVKLSVLGPILVLVIWWTVTELKLVNPILLPRLDDTLARFFALIISAKVFPDLWATVYRTVLGFGIASVFGIISGLVIGKYAKIYKTFEIVIDFFRSLPATAMFPLFLLIFGIGSASKIAIAIFISFWIVLLNSAYGVIHSSKTRTKVAKSLGATDWQIFRDITVMEALPQIVVGLRTAISLSLIVVVVSEMFIGSTSGIGQKIYDSYLTYETTNLYAWLLIVGLVGYILNNFFVFFEKRTLHWVGR